MNTILIIEDDTDINHMLSRLLSQNGYQTVSAYSGTEGTLVHNSRIDLILLDLMLPGKSGEEIIGELKAKKNVPVIVMSAIHDVEKKVDLFSLGADDYVTKPFDNKELLARIAVRLKSNNPTETNAVSDKLSFEDISIDTNAFIAQCNGTEIELSKHEFLLLKLLVENAGRTCTKSRIYEVVWDYADSADENTLNVHISKLRKKLKACNPNREYIETVWGIGYRLKKCEN